MYISKKEREILKEAFSMREKKDLVENEDDITVEVDGEVIANNTDNTDAPNLKKDTQDALDGFGVKLAITDQLLQAVNDENTTIQFYNNLIAQCVEEGYEDIANVIKHINEEENIHVGMLQHVMTTISEQAKTIKDGEEEAAQIISGEEDLDVNDTAIEA